MNQRIASLAAAVVMTLVTGTAWAYWSADSTPASNGAAAATSVNQGATPSGSVAGSTVTVSWAATTLANGDPVSGYLVKRYDAGTLALQTIGSACTGTITATSCVESNVPNGSWKYAITPVFATNWQGPESVKSATVTVATDTTAPTNSITLSSVSGGAHLSGTTLYYRGAALGSFRLTNAVADAGSGPASSQTAALTGTTTGWTHTASTVSTPAGGPYVSNPFDWTAGTTSGPGEAVTGRDVTGNSAVTNLTFTNDSTAPTASISYTDGPTNGASVSVSFSASDDGSGINTHRLQRASATITNGSCGSFGAFTNLGPDGPASPYTDTNVGGGNCYKYQYVVTDRVGNQQVATSASVAKVDYAGAVAATSGLLSHWRLGEPAASLTSYDPYTGSSGALMTSRSGEVGAGWTHDIGTNNETISSTAQAYRNGGNYGVYYASGVPASADYSVEADLVYKSNLAGEMAGVVGRFDTVNNDFYMARWEEADNSWNIVQYDSGTITYPNYVANQPDLVVGHAYRLRLEMSGGATTTLRLYVNGVLTVTATDSSAPVFTAAGRAGIMDGNSAAAVTKSSTTGIHFDNFQVNLASYPRAADSKGSNTGDFKHGPTLGAAGALAGDSNTAASFDGLNDHIQMTATTGFPSGAAVRSTELWFKTSSSARQVLFRYGTGADAQEFGLWLNSSGASMTAWGYGSGNDKTFTLPAAVNNGAWHHVVQTYDGSMLTLYIDGVALTPQAATRSTVMDMYGFNVGAVVRPNDSNSGGFFNGSIDEVSFYTSVLDQTTASNHYQLGTAVADTTGPTGGSVDASGLVGTGSRYSTSTTLSLVLNKGIDPSGLAESGAELRRATATLSSGDGSCGTFGSYALVSGGTDPASPKSDTVADQACYRYQYAVSDVHGNTTTYTSPNIKVDTTAPAAPTLAHSAFTNTFWSGSGSTVYYRSGAASGSFTTTATATDAASGIASYAFPALGTNWTSTPGALGVNTYSWSGAPEAPGTKNVTATNNAGLVSANAPFTMTVDDTAPSAGTVTYADTTQTSTSVSVSFTTGTDGGSGIGTRLLQRASAPLTGTTCGTYTSFTTVTGGTNPSSPFTDTVSAGSCYQYQYVVSDNVGNVHTAGSTNVVKVEASCGSQLINNGGFENGADASPWVESPTDVVTNTGSVAARTGSWKALLGGQGTDTTETVSQDVTIPANCTATLTYYLQITTAETSHPWDFFRVQVIDGGTTTTLQTFSDSDAGSSYVQRTVNLSAYAGKTVTLRFLSDEDGSVQTSFWLDDVSLNTAEKTYLETINTTSGLLSHYRLGEATTSADAMAGSAGATLQSRNGETGAAWTKHGLSDSDAVLTNAGRVRKNGTSTWNAVYHTSGVPASADYTVETDVYVASNLTNDNAGVIGRMSTSANVETYYLARYEQAAQNWALYRRVNGSWDWLGASSQSLGVGTTYRLALDMTGSSIRVLVDGVQRIAVTDTAITAAGRGGIALGLGSAATTVTNTTGLHLDNFRISPPLADSKGTNHGDYLGGVDLGAAGAIVGDSSTAATFDGINDHGTVTRQIADDFSLEVWFKSTQGVGTGTQWWSGAGLVDAEVAGSSNDFGMSLRSDGRLLAGVGTPDVSVVSSTGGFNDGAWHHVVFTRTRSSGALTLYVDGVSVGTATGSTLSLTSPSTISFGRIQTGAHLSGSLDEVALYNTSLSAATVAAHHAAGAP